MSSRQIFQGELPPDVGNNDSSLTVGTVFGVHASGLTVTHLMYWQPSSVAAPHEKTCGLYATADGSFASNLIASVNHTPVGSGWQLAALPAPVALEQVESTYYMIAVWYQNAGYVATPGYFEPLVLDKGDGIEVRGPSRFAYGSGLSFPGGSFGVPNYWVDVMIDGIPELPTGPSMKRREGSNWVDVASVRRRENGLWVPADVTRIPTQL